VTLDDFDYPVWAFGFIAPKTLNYLGFQFFDFERYYRNEISTLLLLLLSLCIYW
jgi:hypothetical protein